MENQQAATPLFVGVFAPASDDLPLQEVYLPKDYTHVDRYNFHSSADIR